MNTQSRTSKSPVETPWSLHHFPNLDERVAFACRTDDGGSIEEVMFADLVLIGVSCTGKTTISKAIAASPEGFLVANIPIVLGHGLPKEVDALPLGRVLGLSAHPRLIARARLDRCAQHRGLDPMYADMDYIRLELMHAREIFRRHPSWTILDVFSKPRDACVSKIIGLCSS